MDFTQPSTARPGKVRAFARGFSRLFMIGGFSVALAACGGGGGGGSDDGGGGGSNPPPPTGSVAVSVKDASGINIPGASVVATVGGSSKSGTTDASGSVLLAGVAVGTGTVAVTRETFTPKNVTVTVTANQTASVPVTLDRDTTAGGGVVPTLPEQPPVVSADRKTLEFTIQVVVLNEDSIPGQSVAIKGLLPSAFSIEPCSPSAATTEADCVRGGPAGFDAPYTLLGPGAEPSFREIDEEDATARPYAAAMLFDQSKSIIQNDSTDARLFSAKEFFERNRGGTDQVGLAAFAADIAAENGTALIPQTPVTIYPVGNPGFVTDGTSFFPTLDALATQEGGGTPLYEALCRVMDFSAASAPDGLRKAVVVFTDGKNEPVNTTGFTCTKIQESIDRSVATGVDIFTIGLSSGDVDREALATLANGGRGAFLFAADTTQLITIYRSLGNLLSGRLTTYRLTYRIGTDVADTFLPGRTVLGVVKVNTGSTVVGIPFAVLIP